jgi:ABC-type nickel/cobalt efflux system permease component RcnA
LVAVLLVPASVVAHPLGNFTINHYAEVRIEPDHVLLDVVIDQAEIPAFEARFDVDSDEDGQVSDDEAEAARATSCEGLEPQLVLTADDRPLTLELREAGLTFPPGNGGLSTMRSVCTFSATLPTPLDAESSTTISFEDRSFAERIGWREIVATGSGATVSVLEGEARTTSLSARLTDYPADLLATPPDDRRVVLDVTVGGSSRAPLDVPDAAPIDADPAVASAPAAAPATPLPASPTSGLGEELPAIFRAPDLTPLVLLLSLMTAAALGAGHALTPGHGKTLMAAYLVGSRGTPAHAVGLGLSVSLSHTVGILVLAAVVVGAADVLPPDFVVRAAPVVAAVSIAVIGAWMLAREIGRRRADRPHNHADSNVHEHAHAAGVPHRHSHPHVHPHAHQHPHALEPEAEHSHGGVSHRHVLAGGEALSWRGLFVLGLAGGLIPSTSALLILLGSIAAGRPGFGFVLVLAFGVGMAVVMGGVGLAVVFAKGRLDALPANPTFERARQALPLAAATLVLGFGLYLSAQAIGGSVTL